MPPPTRPADLGAPLLLVNLKVYPRSTGDRAERIARELLEAGRAAGVAVALAPAHPDLGRVARAVPIPVVAQSVDPVDAGAHTGSIPAEAIAAAGGCGSLVNHSEHPLADEAIEAAIARLRARGLVAVVCAPDAAGCRRLASFRPEYLAVEPPELISGRQAVSTARPGLVAEAAAAVREASPGTRLLCGAGVHNGTDVRRALELGAAGVLVASAVATAERPRQVIDELLTGY